MTQLNIKVFQKAIHTLHFKWVYFYFLTMIELSADTTAQNDK